MFTFSKTILVVTSVVLCSCSNISQKNSAVIPDVIAESIPYAEEAVRYANRAYRSQVYDEKQLEYYERIGYAGLIADFAPRMAVQKVVGLDGGSGVEFVLKTYTSEKLLFPSGRWRMAPDGELDPATAVYVDTITDYIVNIRKDNPLVDIRLTASYVGGADSVPIRWPQTYRSNMGPIAEDVLVTDYRVGKIKRPENVQIPIGAKINNNTKLALLRSKGVEYVLNHALQEKLEKAGLKSIDMFSEFSVEISNRAGRAFRFVRISVGEKK